MWRVLKKNFYRKEDLTKYLSQEQSHLRLPVTRTGTGQQKDKQKPVKKFNIQDLIEIHQNEIKKSKLQSKDNKKNPVKANNLQKSNIPQSKLNQLKKENSSLEKNDFESQRKALLEKFEYNKEKSLFWKKYSLSSTIPWIWSILVVMFPFISGLVDFITDTIYTFNEPFASPWLKKLALKIYLLPILLGAISWTQILYQFALEEKQGIQKTKYIISESWKDGHWIRFHFILKLKQLWLFIKNLPMGFLLSILQMTKILPFVARKFQKSIGIDFLQAPHLEIMDRFLKTKSKENLKLNITDNQKIQINRKINQFEQCFQDEGVIRIQNICDYMECIFESIPQLIIQYINNQLLVDYDKESEIPVWDSFQTLSFYVSCAVCCFHITMFMTESYQKKLYELLKVYQHNRKEQIYQMNFENKDDEEIQELKRQFQEKEIENEKKLSEKKFNYYNKKQIFQNWLYKSKKHKELNDQRLIKDKQNIPILREQLKIDLTQCYDSYLNKIQQHDLKKKEKLRIGEINELFKFDESITIECNQSLQKMADNLEDIKLKEVNSIIIRKKGDASDINFNSSAEYLNVFLPKLFLKFQQKNIKVVNNTTSKFNFQQNYFQEEQLNFFLEYQPNLLDQFKSDEIELKFQDSFQEKVENTEIKDLKKSEESHNQNFGKPIFGGYKKILEKENSLEEVKAQITKNSYKSLQNLVIWIQGKQDLKRLVIVNKMFSEYKINEKTQVLLFGQMKKQHNLEYLELDLKKNQLDYEDIVNGKYIKEFTLPTSIKQFRLILFGNHSVGNEVNQKLLPSLKSCTQLRKIDINLLKCGITRIDDFEFPRCVEVINFCIGRQNGKQKKDLCSGQTRTGFSGINNVFKAIENVEKLQEIFLIFTQMIIEGKKLNKINFSQNKSLQKITLRFYANKQMESQGANIILNSLEQLQNIKQIIIGFQDCGIKGKELECINLRKLTNLKYLMLYFADNDFKDNDENKFCKQLKKDLNDINSIRKQDEKILHSVTDGQNEKIKIDNS